jgi:molybdopterin/thiamine biosynthesis adenylyltransferase
MSNHEGGYMLNQVVHGLVDIGVLRNISAAQKKSIRALLWSIRGDYDCNWPEIIDAELAVHLATCVLCASDSAQINASNGYCNKCEERLEKSVGRPLKY